MTDPKTERDLDEAIAESFPASDPPANTVDTGIRDGALPTPDAASVIDNAALSRFELTVEGQTAYLGYERTGETLTLVHTEVPEPLRGHHLGDTLVKAAVAAGRAEGLRLVVVCPFARAYLRKHPT